MSSRMLMQDAGKSLARVLTDAKFARALACFALFAPWAATSMAAGNVVQYGYDAAGNVKTITRPAVAGLSVVSFSPSSGLVGQTVVVSGTAFSPIAANNGVSFNGTSAVVSAATTTSLTVTVPAGATTGPVSVTVGASTVTSSAVFTVLSSDAPQVTSFAPASGASGTVVSVTGANFNPSATTVKLNGVTATATIASTTALSFTVPGATASGSITATTTAGTGVSATDFVVPPPGIAADDIKVLVRLQVGDPSQALSLSPSNHHALVLFDGAQDGYYTFQFDALQASPTSINSAYKIYKPDNTLLASGFVGNLYARTIHIPKLPSSGTYSLLLSPGVANLNTGIRIAMDPLVQLDSSAVALAANTTGETLRARFPAVVGQRLGVGIAGLILTPAGNPGTNFRVYNPDGTQFSSGIATCYGNNTSNPQGNCDGEFTPTQTGEHTIVSELGLGTLGLFSLQVSSQVTGTLVADTPQDITLARVGQDARFGLVIASGDNLAIEMTGITPSPANQTFVAGLYRPDGTLQTTLTSSTSTGSGYLDLGTLTVAGTYVVEVDPSYGTYGSLRLMAKKGPVLNSLDPPTAFAAAVANETPRFTFAGTAGQNVSIALQGLTHVPAGGSSYLKVSKPDGTQLTSNTCFPSSAGGGCKLTLSNLPVTGTYSAAVLPQAGAKVSGNIALAADLTGSLTADTPAVIDATRPGQNARYTFSGTAGASYAIELADLTTSTGSSIAAVTILKPDGSTLAGGSTQSTVWGTVFTPPVLPTTGTYTVLVDVTLGATWHGRLTLKSGSAITVDGSTQALASTYAAETKRFTFAGTANQRVDLGALGLTYATPSSNNTTAYLYRPDGVQAASFAWNPSSLGGGGDVSYVNLPTTGTYSIIVLPGGNSTMSGGTFAISTPAAGVFTIGAAAQTIALSRAGQTARYTFSGTAARLLRVNWSNTSVVPSGTVVVTVYRPDGTTLTSSTFVNGSVGGMDIPSLPSTGTYTIGVDPPAASSLSVDLALVTR